MVSMLRRLALVSALASMANALTITAPTGGVVWSIQQNNVITWTMDVADPTSVTISLLNSDPAVYPQAFTQTLATAVTTADGTFTVPATAISTLVSDAGYTVQFVDANSQAIISVSDPFQITTDGQPFVSSSSAVAPATSSSSSSTTSSTSTPATSSTSSSSRTTTAPYTGSSTVDRSTNVFNSAPLVRPSWSALLGWAVAVGVAGMGGVAGALVVL